MVSISDSIGGITNSTKIIEINPILDIEQNINNIQTRFDEAK